MKKTYLDNARFAIEHPIAEGLPYIVRDAERYTDFQKRWGLPVPIIAECDSLNAAIAHCAQVIAPRVLDMRELLK